MWHSLPGSNTGGAEMGSIRGNLIAAACALAVPFAALAAPADEVKALIDQGKAAEAYATAKKYPEQLGNPAFDFYYGVAAIDSGHAGEGVLALERYIANFPDNPQARLELARGYFVLGDDARAREEFDVIQKTNPPPGVQANIQRFMDAIRARESRYQTTAGFYAEFGIGHDSNVNGGVGSPNITLPNLGAITLLSGTKTADTFGHLGVGGNVSYPVSPGVALFGVASADGKYNNNDNEFNQANANVAGGISFLQDKNLYRLTGSYGELGVDDNWFRKVTGAAAEVNHQLDELNLLNAFVQVADLEYKGANSTRDAELIALGGGWRKAFIGNWQPLMTLSGSYGVEHNKRLRPEFGRKFWSARAGVAVTPAPKWSLSVAGTYQQSKYDGPDLLTAVVRKDKYYGLEAGAVYAFDRSWSVRGEYTYSKNTGNIALYEFDRHVFLVKLRYEYK